MRANASGVNGCPSPLPSTAAEKGRPGPLLGDENSGKGPFSICCARCDGAGLGLVGWAGEFWG